ncbi:MAG: PilX N-terminal domain-containing pilus assembly protein [Candidatus Methylomirabilales bacterium]
MRNTISGTKEMPQVKDERGIALVIALLVMTLLTLLGTTILSMSSTESNIAANEVDVARAFQVADAGVEHSRVALSNLSPSDVLDETVDFFTGAAGKGKGKGAAESSANLTVGSYTGTYTVVVSNNVGKGFPRGSIPLDAAVGGKGKGSCSPSATVDCDRILVVNSTGDIQNVQQIIEAIVRVPAPATTKGAVFMMDGPDAGGPVEIEDFQPASGARIDGNDCNPPGAGGGPGSGPAVSGIAVEGSTAEGNVETDLGAEAWGVTGAGGSGADTVNVASGPTMSDQDFLNWVNSLIDVATPAGSGDCGTSASGPGGKKFGSWANPQICHVQTDAANPLDSVIPNGSTGTGIIIIHDTDPNTVLIAPNTSTVQDFTYEGIVIVVGDGRFRLRGASRIYGTVLQKNIDGSHSGETRLRVRDSSQICYSGLAIQNVQQELYEEGVLAWYETEGS